MKKATLSLALGLFISLGAFAQILFFEDFNEGIPGTFTLTDVDGLTPNSANFDVGSFFADDITTNGGIEASCALSVSWFNPVGVADDWMATPAVTLTSTTAPISLQFDALGWEAPYPDGVEVYISTTGADPSDFTDDAIYSSTGTGEPDAWITRAIDISEYSGQDIYVAFRNNSDDMNILGIDNITIKILADNDAALTNAIIDNITEGERTIDVVVANAGANNISSFDLVWEFDGTSMTENVNGINLNIGENTTVQLSLGNLTVGTYDFDAMVTNVNGETDPEMSDNNYSNTYNIVPFVLDFTLTDSYGTEWNMYDQLREGRMVVLDFFASWCGPCASSTPELNTFYEDNISQVDVFGITIEAADNTDESVNSLGWGGTYPKFSYSDEGYSQYYHYGVSRGFNTGGSIPFFVMICPNPSDPGNSEVVQSSVGFGSGMFNADYVPKIDQCDAASSIKENNIFDYKVYPNPVVSTATIEFSLTKSSVATIKIVDVLGKTMQSSVHNLNSGNNNITIDVNNLVNGIYFVQSILNGNSTTKKITVTK